jgi:hypothetical protein
MNMMSGECLLFSTLTEEEEDERDRKREREREREKVRRKTCIDNA